MLEIALTVSVATCLVLVMVVIFNRIRMAEMQARMEGLCQHRDRYLQNYEHANSEIAKLHRKHRRVVKLLGYDPDALNVSE